MELNFFGKCFYAKKSIIVGLAIIIAALIGVAGYIISQRDKEITIIQTNEKETVKPESGAAPTAQETSIQKENFAVKPENEIKVYVIGCVKSPGIVTLKKGLIIEDAINAAGGATEDADLVNVNRVYVLKENVTLNIKSKKETQALKQPTKGNTSISTEAGVGAEISKDAKGNTKSTNNSTSQESGKINLNSASVEEFDTLPGIGVETAKDIVAFREKNGKFKAISDVMKVTGIKESKFNKIKNLITVD